MAELQTRAISAAVDEVVLLEDRAHVYRRGRLELSAGRHRLLVEGVAPVVADKTLVCAVEDGSGVTLVGATVRREEVFRDLDSDESALGGLERELRDLDRELQRKSYDLRMLDEHATALDRAAKLSYRDLAVDAAWGAVIDQGWRVRLEALRERERELRVAMAELSDELGKRADQRCRLDARIAALENPATRDSARIEIDLELEADTSVALRLDYVVPGACWRPRHVAELVELDDSEQSGARLRFTTEACVWQNTGEDWADVQLELSTERASLGTDPPRLASDQLRWKKKSDAVVVAVREQVVDTAGFGAGGIAASELPGIDDAGEAVNLRGTERVDVFSDGHPYRVPLASFECEVELGLVAYPELSPCVFTRTEQCNDGKIPVLAGPVELIRRSGPVGRTKVLYIAPGERFELGWGPEAELRLKRSSQVKGEESRMLSSWVSREHEVELTLSNLGDDSRVVEVSERVPVSEIDKVKIEVDLDQTTGRVEPDQDGIARWRVSLGPRAHEQLRLYYTVKKHEDVAGI